MDTSEPIVDTRAQPWDPEYGDQVRHRLQGGRFLVGNMHSKKNYKLHPNGLNSEAGMVVVHQDELRRRYRPYFTRNMLVRTEGRVWTRA